MVELFFMHWAVIALSIILALEGLARITAMTSETRSTIRWAYIIKTTGATLLALVHTMMVVQPKEGISGIVPLALLLAGLVFCNVVDRRERTLCHTADCRHNRRDSTVG